MKKSKEEYMLYEPDDETRALIAWYKAYLSRLTVTRYDPFYTKIEREIDHEFGLMAGITQQRIKTIKRIVET